MPTNAAAMNKLAMLIDGDNVSATYMPLIMREAEMLGVVASRRIYGQFQSGRMKSWLKHLDEYDLTPINVSPLTRGKNATDMKLVIEAMDMLNGRGFDGFLIVSSDGDFTPLVGRIRANAVTCYGFGMKKAPAGYKAEFDRFFECDTALAAEKKSAPRRAATSAPKPAVPAPVRVAAPKPVSPSTPAVVASPVAPPAPRARRGRRAGSPSKPPEAPRAGIPDHVVQAVLKIVRARGGRSSFRDMGNRLPAELPNFTSKDFGFSTTKSLLKALNGQHGLEVTKEGNLILPI